MEFAPADRYPYDVKYQDLILDEAGYYPRKRIMKRNVINPNVSMIVENLPPNTIVKAVVRVLTKYHAGPASDSITFRTPHGGLLSLILVSKLNFSK